MSRNPEKITAPIALNHTNQVTLTPPWFVGHPAPPPRPGSFQALVNGEEAFRAVHQAVAQASKSVCIICWGFQPSMHFIRDGVSPPIGQLLETLAEQGVEVRILCYAVTPTYGPMFVKRYFNVTGAKPLEESNTPGRHDLRIQDRPPSSSDEQYRFDVRWYAHYDDMQEIEDVLRKKVKARFGDKKARNLRFASRGFSAEDRVNIARMPHADQGLSPLTKATLGAAPSHHQKMVLVDYDDPARAVGFVMGHNMLDEYWDHSHHSHRRNPDPRRGRNGMAPRQDLSSRVSGPVIADLFDNFSEAWKKETGEALPGADFARYAPRCDGANLPAVAQVLRTQPQTGVTDIKRSYLQAVNNATSLIYIENQYFRWPPLAEKILAAAKAQTTGGRHPEQHGSLYLFVVTNASQSGMGAGVVNTYRMLDSLGRADTIPEVTRLERAEDLDAELTSTRLQVTRLRQRAAAQAPAARRNFHPHFAQQQAATQEALNAAEAKQKKLEQELEQVQDKNVPIRPKARPGLKVHMCTLVAPDTPDKQPWVDVYVHSKLMIVNDAFLTLGSTNINTRSMETDSELNIALDRPEIARPLRQRLWGLHAGNGGGQEDLEMAFKAWGTIIKKNQDLKSKGQPPTAPLVEFFYGSAERKNLD